MTELSFAKQFLTALDAKPVKISSDNVVDAKTYPAQSAYILPRLPNAKRRRTEPATDAQSATTDATAPSGGLTVTLKPMKAGNPTITLPSQAPTTSVYDLKTAYATQAGGLDTSKIKILRSRKPVPDSKSLADVLAEGGGAEGTSEKDLAKEIVVEFSVMLMPGAAAVTSPVSEKDKMDIDSTAPAAPVAQGASGVEVLKAEEFWGDLKGFLMQRIRDEGESEKLVKVFRGAWESSTARP
ncbi:hypothetical protein NA57DRAFT_59958 [Rhizodiscina lignyota]|uniref:Ubiquitin-like domain-containing protein n=1 Tax=Rhizodiscina lignyota TaxID=1504668 RepID=A0A9P4I775_9PEZI|nr:hypothetical protein NA57DRAFT_59958 [Rhizodiscina lignyota]